MSSASYEVLVTSGAERDLASLYDYIAESDSPSKADLVLDQLLLGIRSLEQHPERGTYPRELVDLGIHDYRQVFYKPYRIVYRMQDKQVLVYLVADGRRNMQTLLAGRLLG